MDDEVLERYIRDYIHSVTAHEVVFSWQGGEPTLMGLDFFRKVVALQRKYAKAGQRIENDLQTNGTLLDEDWAPFLKRAPLPRGSVDRRPAGDPRPLPHDQARRADLRRRLRGGEAAAALRRPVQHADLREPYNASRPLDVYRFLRRELGSTYLQFIPIVEIRDFETTAPQSWDAARLPVVGIAGEAGPSGFGRHAVVGRSRRVRLLPVQGLGRVARPGRRQGAGQLLRDAGRPAHGPCRRRSACIRSSAARVWRSSTTAASLPATTTSTPSTGGATCANDRWARWCWRPRRSSSATRNPTAAAYCRACEFLSTAGASAPRTASCARPTASRAQLPLPGPQALLRARRARRGEDGGAAARGIRGAATADVGRGRRISPPNESRSARASRRRTACGRRRRSGTGAPTSSAAPCGRCRCRSRRCPAPAAGRW